MRESTITLWVRLRRPALAMLACLALILFGAQFVPTPDSWLDDRGRGDAPVGIRESSARRVWENIDKFMNVVPFCIGVNGIYTHTRQGPPVVVKDDGNCEPGGLLYDEHQHFTYGDLHPALTGDD